jgi:serine-type D-Ala-D-Ala carboxypeptidase/endopeptidase
MLISLSCSNFDSNKLVKLPKVNNQKSLDSLQAKIVYKYARFFPNGTQLSIYILSHQNEKYVGIERRNDSLVYVDNSDSTFEIGSITKPFTGIMLANLVFKGKVNPNEPIKNILHLPLKQSSLHGVEITLVHLANHTSGLPFEPGDVNDAKTTNAPVNRYDPYQNYTIERLNNYLSNKMIVQSTPGQIRKYSNLNFGLLGHILTLISGKSYEKLLFETICNPLGMNNTYISFNDERKRSLVRGRDEFGNPLPPDHVIDNAFIGATGIKSSAKDLAKFIKANIYDTTWFFLAQKTTKVTDQHFTGSLAWETYHENGKHHVGAFGATSGYTCGLIFERNQHVGIVVLTNVSAYLASKGSYIDNLCKDLYGPLPNDSAKIK